MVRQAGRTPRSTRVSKDAGGEGSGRTSRADRKDRSVPVAARNDRVVARSREISDQPQESPAQRKFRAERILRELKRRYPGADCALRHGGALELLISTILSAQSTDESVNKVTPVLFSQFPTAEALAGAEVSELEGIVHATGFFRQKSRNIRAACERIVQVYGGQVPDTMEGLTSLPGVARKTANVVLGTWFGRNDGVVVDTHVGRLATRMGLTWRSRNDKDAVRIEQDLMEVIPRGEWTYFGHAMIAHGRRVCGARRPECGTCALAGDCPSAGSIG